MLGRHCSPGLYPKSLPSVFNGPRFGRAYHMRSVVAFSTQEVLGLGTFLIWGFDIGNA